MTFETGMIQSVGLFGMLALILSFQFKRRRTIILMQLLGSVFFGVHFFLLGSITAAAMNATVVLRNALFARYNRADRPWWPFALVMIITIVATIVTWSGWISLLPMSALLVTTIGLWYRDEQKIRLWSLGSPPCWITHNIIVGSVPGIINEAVAFISILVSYLRYRRKHKAVR